MSPDSLRSSEVRLTAGVAETAGGLPSLCARHGAQVARNADFVLQSRVKLEGSRVMSANIFGMTSRLAERGRKVRVTHVRGWPLCRVCSRTRSICLWLSIVLFWGGLALLGAALLGRVVIGHPSSALGIPLLLGFFMMIASVVPFVRGSLPRLTQARTSEDGTSVVITNAHPSFVSALQPHTE